MKNTSIKHKPQEQKRDVNEQPSVDTGLLKTKEKIPFFSVCIPTYNRATFLPQAIESVLSQDFIDFELIICDNASTDDTQAIVSQYQDDRIRYVRYGNLVNMWANHNRCIGLAQAEWLIFLHSDDRFNINALSVIKNELNKFENLDILAPCFDYIQPYRNILQAQENQIFLAKETSYFLCLVSFAPSGVCFFRNSFQKYGNFLEEEFNLNDSYYCFWSDGVLEIQWLLNGAKFYMSEYRWFFYNQGDQSKYVKMQKTMAFYKSNFPIFDSFFLFHYKNDGNSKKFLIELAEFLQKLPDGLKVSFLKKCCQAGYIAEANYVDKLLIALSDSHTKNQDYIRHVIPLKFFPKIYWFLLSLKRK